MWWSHEWSTPYRERFQVKNGCGRKKLDETDIVLGETVWQDVFDEKNPPCKEEWMAYYIQLLEEREVELNYETRPVNRGDLRLKWRDGRIDGKSGDSVSQQIWIPVSLAQKNVLAATPDEGAIKMGLDDTAWDSKGNTTWVAYCNKKNDEFLQMSCESSTDDFSKQAVGRGKNMFPMVMNDRADILARGNTAYFISIIIVQWADLMICKTRIKSLFTQGMTNIFMNWALLFETALGGFLVYSPVANTVCGTRSIQFLWWLPAIPFAIWIYTYDELRKAWIRNNRHGWLENTTYW